jgi:hypothetical protein
MTLFDTQEIKGFVPPIKSTKKKVEKVGKSKLAIGKRYQNCKDVISEIEKGDTIHYASMGEWSMHDLLEVILDTTGPADVYIATWSMSTPGIEAITRLINAGKINKIFGIFDWRIKIRAAESMQLAKHNFSTICLTNCHAKVTVIENEKWKVSVVTSANYTNNPRIETGVITEGENVSDFHKNWMMETILKSDPFEENGK